MARQSSIAGLLVAMCWFGVAASAARGAAILTQDSRTIEASASVLEGQNLDEIGPFVDGPAFGAPFDAVVDTGTLVSTPTGAAQAQADAGQTSSFDAAPTFTTFTASGDANANYIVDPVISSAAALAVSEITILFTVASVQSWSITASTLDEGGASFAYVRLREAGSSSYLFELAGSGELADSAGGELQPAEYELTARASASAIFGGTRGAFPERHARFEFEIVVVPEPGGLALLVIGGLGQLRRRS